MTPSLSVIVPAYNEAERLPPMLREVLDFVRAEHRSAEIIVVDDGSTDGTSEEVRRLAASHPMARLIRLPQNRGKGYAVRTGVVNATGERILFADADGSTPIAELHRLERAMDAGADVAVGSRALAGEGVVVRAQVSRRLIGRVFQALVRALTITEVVDTQCGFKLFSARAGHELFSRLRMNRFSFDVEVLMMAVRWGFRVTEVPVNWTHRDGSKVNVVTDGLAMAADLFRIRSNALRGRYAAPHIRVHTPPRPTAALRAGESMTRLTGGNGGDGESAELHARHATVDQSAVVEPQRR
jgi:dolichyl-phosphate beta-glucosyltransferase